MMQPHREFTITEAFRLSLSTWFRNLVPFTLLTAVVYLPVILWGISITHGELDPERLQLFGGLNAAVVGILNMLLSAALTYGVVMELRGERASIGACIVIGLRRFFPVIGVTLLMMLAIGGGFLLLIIPGIVVTCMLYVAVPAAIVERPGLLGALRRSRVLTQGKKMQIFGLYLLSAMLLGTTGFICQEALLGDPETAALHQWPTFIYAEVARLIILGPLAAVIPAVTYFLLRQEKEGASVPELASVFE